jgi:hypothetical protein
MIHGCAAVPGTYSRGVGFMRANECTVLLVKRQLVEQYFDYEETIRHEVAHCNGWRHDVVTAIVEIAGDHIAAELTPGPKKGEPPGGLGCPWG